MSASRPSAGEPSTAGSPRPDAGATVRPRVPTTPRERRVVLEGAVVAAAFVLCLLGGLLHADDTLAAPPPQTYLLAAASSAVLPARRRAPVATMFLTTAFGMLAAPIGLLPTPLLLAPTAISAYALAVRSEGRAAAAVLFSSAALLVAVTPFFEAHFSWEDTGRLLTVGASPLVAAAFGRSARHRRAYVAVMAERARRAEETRESEARQRVVEERIRIARELHDLVAHQITLANAQAVVAAHLFDTRPEQTRTSLEELVRTTRHALDELRAAVGLLRQPDDAPTPTDPAPGLAQVPALLQSFRRAGLRVPVREDGTATPLPPATDLTAYRVIQEALTNVTKHAAVGSAEVHLTWSGDQLTITVTDAGRGSLERPGHAPGYGLIGMRERVTAVGGSLVATSPPEGGFLVSAQLPLPGATPSTAGATGSENHRPTASTDD
ncbi:sensor histidine kinase [Desertihabitans aurantiacus]|uniref:sensor histidine kinase n=1 Tax=Desertihabitans aurantiacus TaxID=2282477 RepID=UPI000DF7C6EE|nr:sensor histidine kinase [Desertihabitans aurantiacus]